MKELDKVIRLIELDSVWEYTPFTLRFRVNCLSCDEEFLSPSTIDKQFCSEECKSVFSELVKIARIFDKGAEEN